MKHFIFCVAIVSLLTGCVKAELLADGYHHPDHNYIIPYKNVSVDKFVGFLGDDWILDNFEKIGLDKHKRRSGGDYSGNFCVDLDNDGEREKVSDYYYDLSFTNARTSGFISIKTGDLSPRLEKKDLDFFLENYVIASREKLPVPIGYTLGFRKVKIAKFSTKIAEKQTIQLGDYNAVVATIDRSDLLNLEPGTVTGKVRIFVAKIDGVNRRDKNSKNMYKRGYSYEIEKVPGKVLLLAVYYETPDNYQESLKDFESLIESMQFKNQ